jgi:fatty acid desaturase
MKTHGWLIGLSAAMFSMLLVAPWWMAIVPAVLLQHRIGILLHEYIHGIPFRRYRWNVLVLLFYDGLFMLCGFLELFRATHLAHHRWLNRPGDPAYRSWVAHRGTKWSLRCLLMLELPQHLAYLRQALTGNELRVSRRRIAGGVASTCLWVAFWVAVARRPDIIALLAACTLFNTAVSSSLRGAVEHHGAPGSAAFSNEYRPFIPMFNMNRHLHHHMEPRRPWYLLRYQTPAPLPPWKYLTCWFDVYVRHRLVLLAPQEKSRRRSTSSAA